MLDLIRRELPMSVGQACTIPVGSSGCPSSRVRFVNDLGKASQMSCPCQGQCSSLLFPLHLSLAHICSQIRAGDDRPTKLSELVTDGHVLRNKVNLILSRERDMVGPAHVPLTARREQVQIKERKVGEFEYLSLSLCISCHYRDDCQHGKHAKHH